MRLSAQVTGFTLHSEQTRTVNADVPAPGTESLRAWASEHLIDLDPFQRPDESGLRVLITECSERLDLVGRQFDWHWQ